MPPSDDQSKPALVNWAVVATNAVGIVLGLLITAGSGSLAYLVYRLPSAQSQILQTLVEIQKAQAATADELKRLEQNDRRQDDRILRLEER